MPGTPSYIDVAEGRVPPATYFSLGDDWGTIAAAHNLTDSDMFDAFNVPFLERVIRSDDDAGDQTMMHRSGNATR